MGELGEGFAHGPQLRAKGVFIGVALVMDYGQGRGRPGPRGGHVLRGSTDR
jgi:hypothetical protein